MSPDTRSAILQTAERLIRTRGYAAFSYADLAESAAITKAGVHYYFPTKEELIVVLVREYLARFTTALDDIKQQHADVGDRLRTYAQLFLEGFEDGMLPFCGALAAERSALPEIVRRRVTEFFRIHLDWLSGVLDEGVAAGELPASVSPQKAALLLLTTLEGGSLVGWAMQQKDLVLAAFADALRDIETTGSVRLQRSSNDMAE